MPQTIILQAKMQPISIACRCERHLLVVVSDLSVPQITSHCCSRTRGANAKEMTKDGAIHVLSRCESHHLICIKYKNATSAEIATRKARPSPSLSCSPQHLKGRLSQGPSDLDRFDTRWRHVPVTAPCAWLPSREGPFLAPAS